VTFKNLRILSISIIACLICYANAIRFRSTRDLALAMDIIGQAYVEPADPKDLYRSAMNGMMKSLDPHSSYIAADSLQSFQSYFEQQFGGLGVSLDGPPSRPYLTVVTTLFNSPAFRAGLLPGDVITKIDDEEVRHSMVEQVSKKLRGKEGTSVTLEIERAGSLFSKTIVREKIDVESVIGDRRRGDGTWDYTMQYDPRIAYFRIELFGERTATELQKAIESCKDTARGLVIDLRDNSGGLLLAATDICDMFLNDGQIVTTRGRDQKIDEEIDANVGTVVPNSVPIAVIVNENSASSSEIVAACLKDRNRCLVVGVRSFGKGSVQNVIPLEGGRAALRLTTAYYYPPSGHRIHRRENQPTDAWGVDPSEGCVIDLTEEELAKTIARFRQRSDPSANGMIPQSTEIKPASDSLDPSLNDDGQLLLAVRKLQEAISGQR
jgi:carboxyl-terminal processing protease